MAGTARINIAIIFSKAGHVAVLRNRNIGRREISFILLIDNKIVSSMISILISRLIPRIYGTVNGIPDISVRGSPPA